MEEKKLQRLSLRKETVCTLSREAEGKVLGGESNPYGTCDSQSCFACNFTDYCQVSLGCAPETYYCW